MCGRRAVLPFVLLLGGTMHGTLVSQEQVVGPLIRGRVTDHVSALPIAGAIVALEGSGFSAMTDTAGNYNLINLRPGPAILLVRMIGYAPARVPLVVPPSGILHRNIALARNALELAEIIVTADPAGRARGELGTASVIEHDAIVNQTAASIAGILELVPGIPLAAPGLEEVQQIQLRTAPVSSGGITAGPSGADIAAFGTTIILDGVPLSNNANLQNTGPRGELRPPSSSGGGIDLRRIPASTIERVEVIRGVPSARYGDLTHGVIVVDTRAGRVSPAATVRYDARTTEASLVGGWRLTPDHTATAHFDVARTRKNPGITDADVLRLTGQLAHRAAFGLQQDQPATRAQLEFDTRLDFFRVVEDNPEQPDVLPGFATRASDFGFRLSERARFHPSPNSAFVLTLAMDHTRQRSFVQSFRLRGALPFTDRLEEGLAIGRYVGGEYLSRVDLEGDPWLVYGRGEWVGAPRGLGGLDHLLRAGFELRREWNEGAGYQFDIEFPPQVRFNGVQGFDRPRRFDAVPPLATSALYLTDRISGQPLLGMPLQVQVGARVDVLHRGTTWISGYRDLVWQPRMNVELGPRWWLRIRAGVGKTAKYPSLGSLFPPPQYFDVVNVNWFVTDPAERLAVLTTSISDPTNPDLGLSATWKREVGAEMSLGRRGGSIAVVLFDDRTTGAVGFRSVTGFLTRARYALSDSSEGTGVPPTIIQPPAYTDTVPILIDEPTNNLTVSSKGWEVSASLPEIPKTQTRLDIQAAFIETRVSRTDVVFGSGTRFSEFQLNGAVPRAPYWEGATGTGQRLTATFRLVHHQPLLGLVITGTMQFILRESRRDIGGTDTLSFAGYVTRAGELVPVPTSDRTAPQFADLRQPRGGLLIEPRGTPDDWLLSLQVSKTLPLGGRFSFYAFNALDREGRFARAGTTPRPFPRMRFGLDIAMPLRSVLGAWMDP